MVYTSRIRGNADRRPQAFWGALIPAAINFVGGLITSSQQAKAQKRALEEQQRLAQQQLQVSNQNNLAATLNNYASAQSSYDDDTDYNLKYRNGGTRRLGSNGITITDGGNARKIGNNTYLLRGGSHEDINETGQTGIGINVGGNQIEAEGGEVAQKKDGALRIFSAQPILGNGMSPAQAILRGYNKDKVFAAQQRFKRNNHLKDDGSKFGGGGYADTTPSPLDILRILYDKTLGRFDDKNPFLQTGTAPTPSRSLNLKQVRGGLVNRNMLRTNRVYRIANMREVKDAKTIGQYRKLPEDVTLPTKTVRTRSGRTFEFGKAGGNSHGGKAAAMGEPWTGTTSGGYNESKYVIATPSRHTTWSIGHAGNYSKPLPADAIKKGSGLWKKFDAKGNTGISTKRMVVYKDLGNGRYLRLAKSKYKLGGLTSKDRGSSKHPYPSVSSKDFAGGNRSYPIPTKADAVDALRLAGLHGRSDVRSKVYSKYPELRKKAKFGDWFTSLFNNNTAAPKKTVHFYKSKSGRVFKTIREATQDNYNYNNNPSYRMTDKAAKYSRSLIRRDITIPYIKNKAVTLNKAGRATGARVSTNQLDSIAKYANRAGLSIPTAFGMVMKESTFNNPTVYGTQFIQNKNDGSTSGSWINNHNWNYMRNPYAEAMHAAFRNKKNKTTKDINNQLANGEKYADKLAEKLKAQTFITGIEDGFRKYKTNPYGYNPGQKDYVRLVNQNARDIMNSPQIQQWYKTSPYIKGRKYKCGGRISLRPKAAFGDWVRTNRDDNALADFLYESGLFDRESWNTMLRDIHEFTGMGGNPYNTDDNIDAVMTPAFTSSSSRMLSQLAKSPEASYTLRQVLGLPTKEMVRKRIAGDIAKRIGVARAARQSSNFRNYNIARMQAANAEASFSPFANQVRYAEGKPVLVNTNGYYTTAGNTISRNARNMTSGANPFLYAPKTSDEALEGLNRVIFSAKQGAKSAGQKVGNKLTSSSTYRNSTFAERVRDANGKLIWKQNYKYKPWVKATAGAAGTVGVIGLGIGLSNTNSKSKNTKAQLDAKGQPISPYIARPQEQAKTQNRQVPNSIARKDTTRRDTTKQVNKVVKRQVRTTPQYIGNTTKGNYQLDDGETKVINGIKYTRRGNTIINHKTNVGYIYDKNGNYTGQADYSKVGNFNQAFDAARAAGRNQFIYRAGKYNNYSTAKETNAKKEALNRKIGARRIAKRMGGLTNTPVGNRKKYLPGGTANPWDEYKVPDYGGTAPWQVSNKYDVNVPYPIGKYDLPITTITAKKDTFNDEMSKRMRAGTKNLSNNIDTNIEVPYLGRQNTFKPATQDYIGLGIDTLAALGSGLFTRSAYNKMNFDYALPNYVDENPVAFDTIYHNEAQRANVERNRLNSRNLIKGNTSSAQTALGRMQQTDTDAMMELNKLADEKANKEVELRNQNAANEQQVRARNAAARNQYYQNVAQIKNAALEAKNNAALAKAQSIGADFSGLSQAWTNFAGSVEQRYNTRQNEAIIAATSKEPAVLSNALQFGYNFSPEVLASIYRSTNDDKLKQLALSRLSPSDRRRYSLFQ